MSPPIDIGSITHRAAVRAIQLGCYAELSAGSGWGPRSMVDDTDVDQLSDRQLPHLSVSPVQAIRVAALPSCDRDAARQLRELAVQYTDVAALRQRLAADHYLDRDPGWRRRLEALLSLIDEVSS